MLKIDSSLCLVKGKDRRIPLHCAVAKGRVKVIRELLSTSLDSITEVTARGETCFHLALKNNRVEAFMILIDHVLLHKKEEILKKNDEQGNSIFHISAHRKQYEVIHVLLDEKYDLKSTISVNSLNKRGLTPLDVLTSEGGDSEIEEMFSLAGALRVENLNAFPQQANSQHLVATRSMSRSVEGCKWIVIALLGALRTTPQVNFFSFTMLSGLVKYFTLSFRNLTTALN